MAESDSFFTQTITPDNSPKLEEFNSSLRIKLKLPKNEQDYLQKNNTLINSASNKREDDEDRHEEDHEKEVNLRICEFCDKTFSNGKALGGHMRVHAPNYKANKKVSAKLGSTSNSMSSPEVAETGETHKGVFKCELCPKEFPSLKSLFGHMRSHPNRHWRGMNPPQHYVAAEEAASSAAEARLKCLGSWRVTGKRGRKGLCSSPVGSSSSSFGSHAEAAADLMLLLAGGGGARDRNESFRVGDGGVEGFDEDEDEDEDASRANKKGKGLIVINDEDNKERFFDEDEVYYLKNLGFLPNYKVNDDDDGVIRVHNNFDNQGDSSNKVLPSSSSPPIIKGINDERVVKINNKTINYHSESIELNHHYPNPIEINVNKFVCTTCGKSFSTYQALGGHRSSHNKDKYMVRGVDASGLTDTGLISDIGGDNYSEDGLGQDDVEAAVIGEHKCKTCNKTFASGQALGGHQRSHYVPWTDNISSSPGQTGYQTGWNGNSEPFDLNVEPPMMNDVNNDEDDEVGDVITFDFE